MPADERERLIRVYDSYAPGYDRGMDALDRTLFRGGRDWVCQKARGRVLEIAIGTGRNLAHYPAGVRLTGVEQSPAMLEVARRRAAELGLEADLRLGDAQSLDFPAGSFDTVVCTLSLCTIPDDARAVSEVRRVLRPGGRFLLLEHVRSPVRPVRMLERLLDPFAVRAQCDHLLREPLDHLIREGFKIELLERSRLGLVERVAARVPPREPETATGLS
jgi:ubiquinone/menaquinone biosynthesis C-methylase UbiE